MNQLRAKPPTRREQVDAVRLKAAGTPSHINAHEARLLAREMPEAAGPVITQGLLAQAGIRGDDRVTNLIPSEQKLLRRHGGSGDRNPKTGLLQFEDDTGTGNPGGGHDASAAGGPGGGGYGGYSGSSSVGGGGYYGGAVNTKPDIANMSLNQLQDQFSQQRGSFIDSLLSMPPGFKAPGYEDLSTRQYAPLDTWGRLAQTMLYGPPRDVARNVPGRFDPPTGKGLGYVQTALSALIGNPLSATMALGGYMRDSMSPEAQEKSMAENQTRGSINSGGNDSHDAQGSQAAGTASGAATAGLLNAGRNAPTQTAALPDAVPANVDPSDQASLDRSLSINDRSTWSGLPPIVQNMLLDYMWRGRSGSGW